VLQQGSTKIAWNSHSLHAFEPFDTEFPNCGRDRFPRTSIDLKGGTWIHLQTVYLNSHIGVTVQVVEKVPRKKPLRIFTLDLDLY
jgi:hypothetical protein